MKEELGIGVAFAVTAVSTTVRKTAGKQDFRLRFAQDFEPRRHPRRTQTSSGSRFSVAGQRRRQKATAIPY